MSMYSRYDLMKPADYSYDSEDGEQYPDPLSINYAKASFTEIPVGLEVSMANINKFWLYMKENYNLTDHDDLLLNLNGIPYIGLLEPGDTIYNIVKKDLEEFNK